MRSPLAHIIEDQSSLLAVGKQEGREAILAALHYFDIFHYPLTEYEIIHYSPIKLDPFFMLTCLQELQEEKQLFVYNEFYSVQDNPLLVHRRIKGNQLAQLLMPQAIKKGRFLFQFPFVRAVGISGSLSKNYADEKSDIDYFIITSRNRLWIARTILHLYKKWTFLTGEQHFHCMNYFIDETSLQLEDQNMFTAIEISTLVPVAGTSAFNRFFEVNDWTKEWLPACNDREQEKPDARATIIKRIMEWLMKSSFVDHIEQFLFRLTSKRWKRKEEKRKRNKKGVTMGLLTGLHFAKSNPGDFQEKILCKYRERLAYISRSER